MSQLREKLIEPLFGQLFNKIGPISIPASGHTDAETGQPQALLAPV